jgi:hypothetical protein
MITNFEEITRGLSDEEKSLITILVNAFKQIFNEKSKAIKGPDLIHQVNEWNKTQGIKVVLTEPRLRKICNFIRSKSIIPLIATSKGYYCSYDMLEIELQIKSLQERADAILNSVNGMKRFKNVS